MAGFCQAFNMSPSEYKALTLIEFAAFLKVLEDGIEE
jgi:hypothetical protein